MCMKIAILGAGAFGTALGGILAEKGHDIDYYDSKVERERLTDVLAGAKYIVLAVPSNAVPHLLPYLPKDIPLIVATKGILNDETFKDFKDYMILSGPGFADDIKKHKKTLLTATDARILQLFETDYLHFDYTSDERGVLMCGALKNVYAILAGYYGLKPRTLLWRLYVRAAAREMQSILAANGADPRTVKLACGKGDLRLTCNYPSRNYEYGQMRARTTGKYYTKKTVEGLSALSKIRRHEIILPEDTTIMEQILEESKAWN